MTKDVLKKKAEESLDKMVTDKGIILGCHEGFCYDEVTDFMSEFAEPREKRIAELTEQNTSLLTSVENLNKTVQELEKENAELKPFKQDCIRLTEDNVVMARQRAETARQLTKAKEIIKDLLLMAKVEHLKERYESVDEAEQFLSEVEK